MSIKRATAGGDPQGEQLTIWTLLERVSAAPLDANIIELSNWIGALDLESAGDALVTWGESYRDRAIQLLDEWQLKAPLTPAELVEPPYERSMFDELVLGRMEWDLGDLVETVEVDYPTERQAAPAIVSVTKDEALELASLKAALALAHTENVAQWGAAISEQLERHQQAVLCGRVSPPCNCTSDASNGRFPPVCVRQDKRAVSLLELHKTVEMPLVQVWLALLLNGFEVEQRGEFYDLDGIWVKCK
jgi:hypothetical protein